jgi:hypothetical protein
VNSVKNFHLMDATDRLAEVAPSELTYPLIIVPVFKINSYHSTVRIDFVSYPHYLDRKAMTKLNSRERRKD